MGTENTGGREVVVPLSATDWPVACAAHLAAGIRHIRPWHGPMERVVYRFSSSI